MVGEILDTKYRIDRQLGAGGMGNVYLATHLGTTRVVAVKVIAPKWAADPHFFARFQREAQACGRLRHPNIVNVTDFGVARAGSGNVAYLVMEFLDGQTLSDFQKDHPNIALPLIADILDQIGLALSEAHRQGIVHRDLKPDNIWLEPNGRGGYTVKVLDFGVAKVNAPAIRPLAVPAEPRPTPPPLPGADADAETMTLDRVPRARPAEEIETVAIAPAVSDSFSPFFDSGADAQTRPGSLLGTPAYMSPEQALGKETDFRSDIYSLAVVAYAIVCGDLPFTGKSNEFLDYHQSGTPRPPSSIRKIPPDVSDTILAGLARDPQGRPASAVEWTRRFHNAVDAEFFALRRSKAFLLQHLAAFSVLLVPLYAAILSAIAIAMWLGSKLMRLGAIGILFLPVVAAILPVFFDNLLRASAALMALDEQVRVRRFLSFRVLWKLVKTIPALAATQVQALFFFGPGWIVSDCLWPVICVVEKLSGRAAIQRSRELMKGLGSAGRALAIRHLALAAFSVGEAVESVGVFFRSGNLKQANVVITATWFPMLALYAGAALFLYDRTAANETGPLLQLDRTPDVRVTSRKLSISSIIWIAAAVLYFLYRPLEVILGRR